MQFKYIEYSVGEGGEPLVNERTSVVKLTSTFTRVIDRASPWQHLCSFP